MPWNLARGRDLTAQRAWNSWIPRLRLLRGCNPCGRPVKSLPWARWMELNMRDTFRARRWISLHENLVVKRSLLMDNLPWITCAVDIFFSFFFFLFEITLLVLIVQSWIILYVYGNWTLFPIPQAPFSYESKILLLNRFLFPFDVIKPFERSYIYIYIHFTIITKNHSYFLLLRNFGITIKKSLDRIK